LSCFVIKELGFLMRAAQTEHKVEITSSVAALMRSWHSGKTPIPATLLQRGFALAYLIVGERSIAIDILSRALDKVRVCSSRELKRLYWRDKHSERPVRRISRTDVDTLQWLIMFECEQDERAQEIVSLPPQAMLTIRYIKHLVQISSALSSFYVNVAITRLLHSYTTSEAQDVYEMLTGRFLGPDEYRRAKAVLMDKLSDRFGDLLRKSRIARGEFRFETAENQECWERLVRHALTAFTPWSTQGDCSRFLATNGEDKLKSAREVVDPDPNNTELRCCHVLIDPRCYYQLMEDFGFAAPETKLEVPRFVMPENENDNNTVIQPPPAPSALSRDEIDRIEQKLARNDARRRSINTRFLTVLVDGLEQAQIDLEQPSQLQIGVEAGSCLIEIRARDDDGELTVAAHFITCTSGGIDYSEATAPLNAGALQIAVTPAPTGDFSGGMVTIDYHVQVPWSRPWRILRDKKPFQIVRGYAFSALVLAIITLGFTAASYLRRSVNLEQQLRQVRHNQQELSPTAARGMISYLLTRDDARVRGVDSEPIPEVPLRVHSTAICLELPLGASEKRGGSYNAEVKTLTGEQVLVSENSLQAKPGDFGPLIEVVVPSDLLRPNTYYTVFLHSPDRVDHFTFKVIANPLRQ
jgi:hypothetical protein